MSNLKLFSMDLAHPIFILILVKAGVKLVTVWLRLESFRLVLVSLFNWKSGTTSEDTSQSVLVLKTLLMESKGTDF